MICVVGDRLKDFTVGVALSTDAQAVLSELSSKNFSNVKTCKHVSGTISAREQITCDSTVYGSIVVVYFPDSTTTNILTLCEVEVLGKLSKYFSCYQAAFQRISCTKLDVPCLLDKG